MPEHHPIAAVVLVVDQNLGVLRHTDDDEVVGIDLAAGVDAAIHELRAAQVQVGVAALRGDDGPPRAPLAIPGLEAPAWAVRGAPRAWIAACVAALATPAAATVFVSADLALRTAAHGLGLRVAPHAIVAAWLASGRDPVFVRVEAPRDVLAWAGSFLPFFVEHHGAWTIAWGAAPADAVDELVRAGAALQRLDLDPGLSEPILLRLGGREARRARPGDPRIVWSDDHLALLAASLDDVAIVERLAARRHGALQAAAPSLATLQAPRPSPVEARAPAAGERPQAARSGFAGPTAAEVAATVARYSGAAPLDAAGAIASRHVRHPHAARAVQALLAELTDLGYAPYTHTFSYQGKVLANVLADLPGTGVAPLPTRSLADLRDLIRARADAPVLLRSLAEELGAGRVRRERLDGLAKRPMIAAVERALGLGGWIPWWRGERFTPGPGAQIVLVGCHLDSTAQASPGYDPATSPAPGADDDASGIACTLAAARDLAGLRGFLTHTVRFCFFNAEEQGMLGSAAYAAHLKSVGAPVKAALCVDMAGHDVLGGRSFEIHAGATDPAVRDASTVVAEAVAKWAAALTALAPAQIYRGTSSATQANRDLYDPAIGRADHASFQQQGWAAVVVSEDFFVNQAGEEAPEPNPNYHRLTDTVVNATYVADIARAVARAAEELAG